MSTSYLGRLESKVSGVSRDVLVKVYEAFSEGEPVDVPHYFLRGLLLNYSDVEEFVFTTKKRLSERHYTGAYAIVGEYGTGKTQYALFLKHALDWEGVKVLYRPLARARDLSELKEEAFSLVDRGHHVVIILDNVEAFISQFGETPEEERRAAGKLANFVELLSERPHRCARGGARGVATVFLLHTDTYRSLQARDERLRRIREIKSLYRLREPREGEELALSVLAVLHACEERCRATIGECGEALVKLLARWGASLLDIKGRMGKGLFIKTCFNFFRRVLRGLGRCPAEATARGHVVEDFVAEVLERDMLHVKAGREAFSAKVRRRRGAGPDLEVRLYRGGLPVGAPSFVFYGEIKSVKSSIRRCIDQLRRYASERPLLLIALAEDQEPVEDEVRALEAELPLAGLVYPLSLIEPVTLLQDRDEGISVLRELLGRDLLSDVGWRVSSLIAAARPPPAKVDYRSLAQEIIETTGLRAPRAKLVRLAYVGRKAAEVFGRRGITVPDPERLAKELLAALTDGGFLSRRGPRTFRVVPVKWRECWDEALEVVSKVLSAYSGRKP